MVKALVAHVAAEDAAVGGQAGDGNAHVVVNLEDLQPESTIMNDQRKSCGSAAWYGMRRGINSHCAAAACALLRRPPPPSPLPRPAAAACLALVGRQVRGCTLEGGQHSVLAALRGTAKAARGASVEEGNSTLRALQASCTPAAAHPAARTRARMQPGSQACAASGNGCCASGHVRCRAGAHLEPHRCAALLHRLHGILYLENAPLRAPGRHVRVILQNAASSSGEAGSAVSGEERRRAAAGGWPAVSRAAARPDDRGSIVGESAMAGSRAVGDQPRSRARLTSPHLVAEHGGPPAILNDAPERPAERVKFSQQHGVIGVWQSGWSERARNCSDEQVKRGGKEEGCALDRLHSA